MKKYFKTRKEAIEAKRERKSDSIHVYRMPKGSRKAGWYAVCPEMEYLNTY